MKRLPAKTFAYIILGIITLIIEMSVTCAHAQQVMPIGNPTALNLSKGGFHADSSLQLPFRKSMFVNFDSTGRMYYNRYGDSGVYYHNGLTWIKLLSGATSGTVTSITAAGYMLGGTVTTTGTFTPDTAAGKLATKTNLRDYFKKADSNTHGNAITYDYYYANLPLDADSSVFSTIYRNDTGNANLRAQIALGSADSAVYATMYRLDSVKRNLRLEIAATSPDSAIWQTKYRTDTMRNNLYPWITTGLAGAVKYADTLAMLVPYLRKSDSINTYFTKYRADTMRNNLYPWIFGGLAGAVKYTDTSGMLAPYLRKSDSVNTYFTKYRSDTMRNNIYSWIGATNATITGSTYITVSGAPNYTVVAVATVTPTVSTLVARDANANVFNNNIALNITSVTSAAGTTTLTAASSYTQRLTGTTTQTYQLPVTTTLSVGQPYKFVNLSTGYATVNTSGGNTLVSMEPNSTAIVVCITASGTGVASWDAQYAPPNCVTVTGSGTQTYTLADNATLESISVLPTAASETITITVGAVTYQAATAYTNAAWTTITKSMFVSETSTTTVSFTGSAGLSKYRICKLK